MGTYGPGEIRGLCDWLNPEIAVITAIGPVHLERMGSLDNIARAKAEILERARVGVINIDHPHLAGIAASYRERGGTLITCSTNDPDADVHVMADGTKAAISVHGHPAGTVDMPGVFSGNAACAVGVALAFDIPASEVVARLANLPRPEHRQAVHSTENGITVIDDTYNSNPDGALSAITALASAAAGHRRVLVTCCGGLPRGPPPLPCAETGPRRSPGFAVISAPVMPSSMRTTYLTTIRNGRSARCPM